MVRTPTTAELWTLTEPPRRIRIEARYVGKSIAAFDSETTSRICTYIIDDGPPPPSGAHPTEPAYSGMALWEEDDVGNVTVKSFEYPG